MKKTLMTMALAAAGIAAVTVAQAQGAPPPAAPPGPAPTATTNPNAPPAAPPSGSAVPAPPPSAAPAAPPAAPPSAAPPADAAAPGAPQVDPNAPPAPPAVAPAPPPVTPPAAPIMADPNAPPPGTPFTPPPVTQVNWGAPQGGDTVAPTVKAKPLRWRGTQFEWYQYANTQLLGVGSDYIGQEDFSYVHLFRFTPTFYIVDEPRDKLTVSAVLWGSVEATTSNTTTYAHEFEFRDTALGLKYTRTLLQSAAEPGAVPEWFTKGSLSVGMQLPTSKLSINQGRYLGVSVGPALTQQAKILGTKSDWFPNVTLGASLSYLHSFSRANVPTYSQLRQARQDLAGQPIQSDVLSGRSLVPDNLIVGVSATLPIYKDLSFGASYRYWMKWKYGFKGAPDCVQISTGCVQPTSNPDPQNYFPDSILDVSLVYNFFDVVEAAVGYQNWTTSIGPDGKILTNAHNPFYSSDASFYLDLTANLDSIYSKASGRDKKAVAKGQSSSWF